MMNSSLELQLNNHKYSFKCGRMLCSPESKTQKTLLEWYLGFTFSIYSCHEKLRWFHLSKETKPQQGLNSSSASYHSEAVYTYSFMGAGGLRSHLS